ncbi:hypothetical protein [Amycolatopsis sp. lyj-112]|uniref:hypothetical protein n=1 Tax=Amycolatopsis sp. lyj-112 TaxID=2789288 RepID=UPI00397C8BFB
MGSPIETEPHTLAQFARRAGISESRARGLYAQKPSGLPQADRTDAGGKPLWFAATIDTWCARTGRAVADDALWIFRAPPATEPAVELMRRVVTVHPRGAERTMFAIVWDTAHGHVVYLQPLGSTGGDHKDWMAVAATELIEPRWWSTAVVIMPIEDNLTYTMKLGPIAYIYKIIAKDDGEAEDSPGKIGRWLRRTANAQPRRSAPRAKWQTDLKLADISAVIGHTIPCWLTDTTTVETARKSLSYPGTLIVPDTITEWPAIEKRLDAAIAAEMPGHFPAGFAALAADAHDGLTTLRTAHENAPNTGPGWTLVARPAAPAPPVRLEQLITKTTPVTDLDLVAKELVELRELERDLDIGDPRGDAFENAAQLLAHQLRATKNDPGRRYRALAEADFAVYSSAWDDGPVINSWRENLTPTSLKEALQLRRVQRLFQGGYEDNALEAFRDDDGRYVIVVKLDNGDIWFQAEWPVALDIVDTWTDDTILAGDATTSTTTLLALTPTEDGRLRTDPVPLPSVSREAFGYGYGGGGPSYTYSALLRCALGPDLNQISTAAKSGFLDEDGEPVSQLWKAISTTIGPLRLSWPQVQLWARADAKRSTT